MLSRLSLRLRIFLFFLFLALGSIAIVGGSLAFAWSRSGADPGGYITAGLMASFLSLGLVLFVWRLFDENVALAIERLSADMRARAHSEVDRGIDSDMARYLGDLAPAAEAIVGSLQSRASKTTETVARSTEKLRGDTSRLSGLLSDVKAGLLLCSGAHQLVFYNAPAVALLADTGRPRLDRSVFDLLREGPIRQTYTRLRDADAGERHADVLVSTTGCGRAFTAHMRLIDDDGAAADPGYVLTLLDITSDLRVHAARERLLDETMTTLRKATTSICALIEARGSAAPHDQEAIDSALRAEADSFAADVRRLGAEHDAAQHDWWPMQDVRASHIFDGVRAQLGDAAPSLDAPHPHIVVRCDGFALTTLLGHCVEAIQATGADALSISVIEDASETGATLRMTWQGAPLDLPAVDAMLDRQIGDAVPGQTGHDVLAHHGTALWPETTPDGDAALVLPLPRARRVAPLGAAVVAARPTVYDFDLMNQRRDGTKAGKRLSDLTYVVFDTETTGLEPQNGDEIVQIAAVRLVNGKIVEGEVIDQLVDPERSVPKSSTEIHGISEDMVQGMPTIREAGARFHRFCEGAVLVAHNAPFDLAFFHRHAADIGAEFDHPVFDTVLLSAMLFGQYETHTLDALAERFGVIIPEDVRHTAYGDTVATAEVFRRMIPMLEARGMTTFDDVFEALTRDNKLVREMKSRVTA